MKQFPRLACLTVKYYLPQNFKTEIWSPLKKGNILYILTCTWLGAKKTATFIKLNSSILKSLFKHTSLRTCLPPSQKLSPLIYPRILNYFSFSKFEDVCFQNRRLSQTYANIKIITNFDCSYSNNLILPPYWKQTHTKRKILSYF